MPKTLFDHWNEKHKDKMNCYLIKNRALKQQGMVLAPSKDEALKRLEWDIRDCFISEMKKVQE